MDPKIDARTMPAVDDHLVVPETTRQEMVRGQLIEAAPAKEPHGDLHFGLNSLIGSHLRPGFTGSSDLLTRVGPESDFATDTCIRRQGIDPKTGRRYLEELAFEIVSEQSLRHITIRAEDLSERGVRRLVAIFVEKGEVREWLPEKGEWLLLDNDSKFSDPTLVRPVRVSALLNPNEADDEVALALCHKGNRVFEEVRSEGREENREQGRRATLLSSIGSACEAFEIPIEPETRSRLEKLDTDELKHALGQLLRERRLP